jgi:hypothetical protein
VAATSAANLPAEWRELVKAAAGSMSAAKAAGRNRMVSVTVGPTRPDCA